MKNGNGNGNGKKPDTPVTPLNGALPADPKLLMFVVQLAMNDGNASAAARSVGWSARQGRKLVEEHPGLRELAKDALRMQAETVIRRWVDMHEMALQTIHRLMNGAEDEKTQLAAAGMVVERVEGRVPQKIEVDNTDPRDVFASVVTRFASSYHLAKGVPFSEAMLYAEKHPEVVEEWAKKNGLARSA